MKYKQTRFTTNLMCLFSKQRKDVLVHRGKSEVYSGLSKEAPKKLQSKEDKRYLLIW